MGMICGGMSAWACGPPKVMKTPHPSRDRGSGCAYEVYPLPEPSRLRWVCGLRKYCGQESGDRPGGRIGANLAQLDHRRAFFPPHLVWWTLIELPTGCVS